MNWVGLLAVLLGLTVFIITLRWQAGLIAKPLPAWLWCLAALLALPVFSYDLYYSRLLGEPLWLYRLRAVPGSEFLVAFAGVIAGLIQTRLVPRLNLSPIGKKALVPVLLVLGLLLPYLKPVLRPLHGESLREAWTDGVCHQSTPSTCGPASVATVLRQFGNSITERELAQEAFSSASGTENWYLARAIRRRGLEAGFWFGHPMTVPLPAVAGVRLPSAGGAGHFIAVLARTNEMLTIADPLEGIRRTGSLKQLETQYQFTGFFLTIRPGGKP